MGANALPSRDDGGGPVPFRVEIVPEREAVRVCPRGEVDLSTVGAIRAQIDELKSAGFTRVILDLRGATFLDSTGLRLVLEVQASSASDGWEFGVIEGPAEVQRPFQVAGVAARVPFVDPAALPQLRRRAVQSR